MSVYRVIGPFRYREREIGEVFVGQLERDEEARALKRGNIEVIDSSPLRVDPTSATPPRDWVEVDA